ncbi:uncharacterized protein LOC114843500 [Betta splendens]|uniref:Uncharacterized protein LOC114843500 n=1 Tax=Betta splendens TaxID=158456 RepID=A0A6P7KWD6_BETSP|nr:uncharacterized protein LOC114843500 [Betta splendens]
MDQYELEMKEEDADIYQDQNKSDMEFQDPSLTEQDRSISEIKKEEQDRSTNGVKKEEQDRSISEIKKEEQDPNSTNQDLSTSEIEKEEHDRSTNGVKKEEQDRSTSGIKKEEQGRSTNGVKKEEQDRSTNGVKEEEQDPNLTEQDQSLTEQHRSTSGIKEEQQDRSISGAEEEQQDRDHAGPTDQQCKRHQPVFTTMSSVEKCVRCVGPVSSLRWLGYKCKVCLEVWHKSCFGQTENENLEDLYKLQLFDDDLTSDGSGTADEDEDSSEEEYIPDSEASEDCDSVASMSVASTPSKIGPAQTQAVASDTSTTEDEVFLSAAKPCNLTSSDQQRNDGQKHIFTSTPVTSSSINYCYICGKAQTKFARHLRTHKTHVEIERIFSLPKKSKVRKRQLEKVRNRGNFQHNAEVLQSGMGSLKVKRKTKTGHAIGKFIHCMYCKGLYIRKELWRHVKRCPEKPEVDDLLNEVTGKKKVLGFASAVESGPIQKISSGVWKLLGAMRDDDVTSVVRNDVCILQFAQSLFNRHGQDTTKYEYMRQKLREVGRLLLCLRKDFSVQNIEDAIRPANFHRVIEGVKKLSGFDEETHSYQTPSLALKLGHILNRIAEIIHWRARMATDENLIKSTETFKRLYRSKWSELLSHSTPNTLSDAKYNKPSTLPFTKDVQKLHQYLEKQSESAFCNLKEKATQQNYANLAKVTLAQTVVFNRRRAGEVSKMHLKCFFERDQTNLHEDVAMGLSKVEQRLCKYFTRLEIKGKRGRKVPVLLTPKMIDALSLLTDSRSECCVNEKNVFLFARPKSMSHYRGHDCLRIHSNQCGAKHPEYLRSTQLQKHVATLSQVLNLKNNELDQVADFMGHDIRVHRNFYRLPIPTKQLAKISKMLLSMEKGQLSNMQGKSLDEIEIDDEIFASDREKKTKKREGEVDDDHALAASEVDSGIWPSEPMDSKEQGGEDSTIDEIAEEPNPMRKPKRLWSKAEVTAVMRHFKDHVLEGRRATKNECCQCKRAEAPVLDERTVQNIRDFVRNRGVSVKRKSQK